VLAILGLASALFLLAGVIDRLRFLDEGLAVVLVFIGGKMIGERWLHIPVAVSLGVVGGVLLIALLASILFHKETSVALSLLQTSVHPRNTTSNSRRVRGERTMVVLHGMKMLGGVFVLGRIAAADVAAAQTQAQVHPAIPHFQAFFASLRLWFYLLDLIEMRAFISHRLPRF